MSIQVGNDNQLKVLLVETELERVKYLLRGYLRTRLAKVSISFYVQYRFFFLFFLKLLTLSIEIDKYTLYLLANEHEQKKLAADEIKYMKA